MNKFTKALVGIAAMTGLALGGLATPVLSTSAEAASTIATQCTGNYKVGVSNNVTCVKLIQTALNTLKYTDASGNKLTVDGSYGSKTKAAVIKFQKASGLSQDGVAGPKTNAALDKALASLNSSTVKPDPSGITNGSGPTASAKLQAIVTQAQSVVNQKVPYVWGGGHGSKPGPSYGIRESIADAGSQANSDAYYKHDTTVKGLDCSGFVRYVYSNAGVVDLGGGFVAHTPTVDTAHWTKVTASTAKAGDVVVYYNSKGVLHHIAIYDGNNQNGKIYEAPSHNTPTKWGYAIHIRSVNQSGQTVAYYHYKGI